jgi:exodeoxyribonuclease VII large subunit
VASFDFRAKISGLRLRLQKVNQALGVYTERVVRGKREGWERLALQLEERGPLKVLERGYAIATDASGKVLRDVDQVAIGAEVRIQLHRGRLRTQVREKEEPVK